MAEYIIDTNVPLIAQGNSDFSLDCESNCAAFMDSIIRGLHSVVIDSDRYILCEYEENSKSPGQMTYIRAFLKWLYTNIANPARVKSVSIHPDTDIEFVEVPQRIHDAGFDRSDRKFVAVAVANNKNAPIVEAGDSKWIGWEPVLTAEGIVVNFLCRDELKVIYDKKMKR